MQSHKAQVREFIIENLMFADDGVQMKDCDDIFESGFVNSLFAMKLIEFVSAEFSIDVTDEDLRLDNFNSVDSICDLIDRYRS